MIDYSIVKGKNPTDSTKSTYFAAPQVRTNLTLDAFAEHIAAHGAAYDKGDIAAILYKVVSCLKEQILAGNSVELGDLGKFYPQLASRKWDDSRDPAEFSAEDVSTVSIRWRKGESVKNMRSVAELNFVTSRAAQALARKDVKDGLAQTTGGQNV